MELTDFFALFLDNDDLSIDEFEIKNVVEKDSFLNNLPLFLINESRNSPLLNRNAFSGSIIRPINIHNLSSLLQSTFNKNDIFDSSIPEEILKNAQKEILPQLNSLGGGYPIQEIINISLNILNFAKREDLSFLVNLSEILKNAADNFDVQKIEQTLNEIKLKLSG